MALLPKTEDELKAAQKLENRLEKLVDAAEVVRDHLRLSKTLKGMYAALGMKVRLAIEKMHPEDFSTSQVLSALNTLASLMHAVTELERKSLNLADPLQQVELTTRYVVSLDSMGNPQEEGDILRALTPDEWAEKYGIN